MPTAAPHESRLPWRGHLGFVMAQGPVDPRLGQPLNSYLKFKDYTLLISFPENSPRSKMYTLLQQEVARCFNESK